MPKEDKFAAAADSQAPAEPVDLSRGGGEDNAATQIFMSRDLPSEEEQAGPVVVGGGMGDYDPTGQYDDLTPGSEGEAEEESGAVPDLAPKSEGDYEPTGSLPDLTPQGEGNYEPTASLSDMAADSIPDLSPPPDGEVDGQVHQPTMIMSAAEVEASEPGEDEKPLPREPSKPGRSKAKNRSLQKRPPRKPGASTGTEALSGRKGRPGPLTGPEPRPAPKPKKKKSALLGIVATFLGGLCLAGLIGYFMFMYKGDTPGETVPDKPGELTKPVTGPDKNGPPADLLVDDKPPPSDGGSLAGFGVEPDPEPPTAPDGGELDGVEVAVAARDGGAEDPPPADAQAGDAQPEDPKPDDPKPDDPKPDDPKPDDPKPDDPKPDDPKPDDPKPDDPKPDDPKPADPEPAEVKKPDPKPSSTKKKKRKKKKTRVAKLSGCELKVVSTPSGADILLNGKASGKTPKTFRGLDPKKNYFVVLRKDGYKKHFEGVKFKGKKKAAVKAALKSSGSKSQPTAKDKKPPATAAKGGKGYLVANTTPWAKVIIDGKDTGKWTPVVGKNKIALKSGRHVITFQTKEGKKLTVKVKIEPGKTAKIIKKIN